MAYTELGHVGDGVYLSHDGYQYWIAVNHHENRVVALEDATLAVMMAVVRRHKAASQGEPK